MEAAKDRREVLIEKRKEKKRIEERKEQLRKRYSSEYKNDALLNEALGSLGLAVVNEAISHIGLSIN